MKLKLKLALALTTVGISMLSPRFSTIPATETEIVSETVTEATTDTNTLNDRYYPATGIVTELDTRENLVIYVDFNGNEWDFPDVEDWAEGDRVALIMDNMGTPESIYDDEPICWRYVGWVY